jgi:hypothetical protein
VQRVRIDEDHILADADDLGRSDHDTVVGHDVDLVGLVARGVIDLEGVHDHREELVCKLVAVRPEAGQLVEVDDSRVGGCNVTSAAVRPRNRVSAAASNI